MNIINLTQRIRLSRLGLIFSLFVLAGVTYTATPAQAAPSGYIWLSKRTVPDWPLRRDGNFARTTNFLTTSLDGRYGLISAGTTNPAQPGGDWTSIYLSDSVTGSLTLATTDEHGQKFPSSLANVNGVLSPHGTWIAWTKYDPSTTNSIVYARDNQHGQVFRSISNDTAQGATSITDDGKVYGAFHTSPPAGALIEVWDVPNAALGALRLQAPQPGPAYVAAISGDGKFAVLVSGGKYVGYDIGTGVTTSMPLAYSPNNTVNAISQTGRYIGYTSNLQSLNPAGLTTRQVYLLDRETGATTWISAPGHGGTSDPAVNYTLVQRSISDDGRFVIFGADGVPKMPPLDPAHAGEPALFFYGATFERDVNAADTRLVVADYAYGIAPNAGVVQFDTYALDPADPPGDFDVYLSGAPTPRISAPSVSVTEVSPGATYEFGTAPGASCSVVDAVDGSSIFSATLSQPSGPRGADGLGQVTASCAYTNSAGVSSSASASFSIVDTSGPLISAQDTVQAEASGPLTPITFPATAVDLVDGTRPVSCNHGSGSGFPVGSTTVTCTSRDLAGNESSASFVVTVVDSTSPALNLPASATATASTPAGAVATYDVPTATDAVDGSTPVTCDHPSGAVFALGTTAVTCTATDHAGNTTSGSFTIRVQDRGAPIVDVPAGITFEATGPAGTIASYTGVSAVDDVDGVLSPTCDHPNGAVFPLGTTVVTCTATDHASNVGASTFTVSVTDTTAPLLTTPAHPTAEATGPLGAAVSFPAPSAHDAVDDVVTPTCTNSSGDQFGLGDTMVTCTATDKAGNAASTTFAVTVVDTTGPALTVPASVSEEATGPGGSNVNYGTASAVDTVDGPTPVSCAPASGTGFAVGSSLVTCTAIDAHSNQSSTAFTVTVTDTTAPSLTLPANRTANATGPNGAVITYSAPTANDTVDGALPVTCDHSVGAVYPLGTTTVTCTATDHAGNTTHASFVVRVVDANAPRVTVPADITAEATGPNGALVVYSAPTATDTVDGALPVTCDHSVGAVFQLGTTTVTCTAADHAGNATNNTFTVHVIDTTAPILTSVANRAATATSSDGATTTYTSPTANDTVDGPLPVTCDHAAGAAYPLGTTTVTCTARDRAGNTGSTSFQVTVTYNWSGLLAPVTDGGTYKLGRTIPVKFALTGPSAGITTATAHLWLLHVSSSNQSGEITPTSTSSATPSPGNTFRYDPTSNQYIFNLDTKPLDPGAWRLRIDLADGTTRITSINLAR